MSDHDNFSQGRGGKIYSNDPRYVEYIKKTEAEYLVEAWSMQGSCFPESVKMQKQFPELKLVRGQANNAAVISNPFLVDPDDLADPGLGHVWLETEDGLIVDPTKAQYGGRNIMYCPLDESKAHRIPTGKCPDCGGYTYEGNSFCNSTCELRYVRYIQMDVHTWLP